MRLKAGVRLRWMASILCLALPLFSTFSSASANDLSAFGYLEAYHDAKTDTEKDELVNRAYQAMGDEPLVLAMEMLYGGPFPADFSESAIEDFIDRFSMIVPPDASYLGTLSEDGKQKAQVVMKMAGIGYEELFTLDLTDKVVQSPNSVIRLWLEEELEAWPKAIPYLSPDEEPRYAMVRVPEGKIDGDIPWGFDIQPDDTLSVQTVFIGESSYDGSLYYEFQLGMMSLLPEYVRTTDPWKAMYVIVVREETETVGSYTNGKGAYRHALVAEVYKVATKEAIRTTVHRGSEPPPYVTGDNAGYGTSPDKLETFSFVINDFVWTFIEGRI